MFTIIINNINFFLINNPITLNILTNKFNVILMPYINDFFRLMLKIFIMQGAFYIMKKDRKEGIDKIKYAGIGYCVLKFTDIFVGIIDQIAGSI